MTLPPFRPATSTPSRAATSGNRPTSCSDRNAPGGTSHRSGTWKGVLADHHVGEIQQPLRGEGRRLVRRIGQDAGILLDGPPRRAVVGVNRPPFHRDRAAGGGGPPTRSCAAWPAAAEKGRGAGAPRSRTWATLWGRPAPRAGCRRTPPPRPRSGPHRGDNARSPSGTAGDPATRRAAPPPRGPGRESIRRRDSSRRPRQSPRAAPPWRPCPGLAHHPPGRRPGSPRERRPQAGTRCSGRHAASLVA